MTQSRNDGLNKRPNSRNGFTLIELMIVIAIISVLAGIALPNFIEYRDKTFCSQVETDAKNATAAISDFYGDADNNHVPAMTDLRGYFPEHSASITGTLASIIVLVDDTSSRCSRSSRFRVSIPTDPDRDGWL